MSEPKGFHFSVPSQSAAEHFIRTAQRLTEITEATAKSSSAFCDPDMGNVIQHLFGLAEIELKRANESIERLRKRVQELAVGHVLEQCS